MAVNSIDAVYENGVFRPLDALPSELTEGQHVRLYVEPSSPEVILQLAAQVFEGLSESEIDEVERIALDRSRNRSDTD